MIVRIDTTNITRGREFTLYAKNSTNLSVVMRAINMVTFEVVDIQSTHIDLGEFDGYAAVAPQLDGYLIAKIGKQKVVKKIGNPIPAFVIGAKPNFTYQYTAVSGDGVELETGNMEDAGDGFYYTTIPDDTAVVKCLNKNFIVNKNLLKMNYEITMSGGELNSSFDNTQIDDLGLPEIELPDATLGDAQLDSTLPDIEIKEL